MLPPSQALRQPHAGHHRSITLSDHVTLSHKFQKDIAWFLEYLPCTNGVYIIDEGRREPVHIFVDICTSLADAPNQTESYHIQFPLSVQEKHHPICNLEALNSVVAISMWDPGMQGRMVTLHTDSAMALAIFQAGKGRDAFIQACAQQIWLECAVHEVTQA